MSVRSPSTDQRRPARPLSRFGTDTRGSVSVETIIVLPMLLWALVATVVFFDGFRTRHQTQTAALTVSDIISRETNMLTSGYLEGMNEVFDFLADARQPTRLRISSLIWNSTLERPQVQWSYGTRGMAPLTDPVLELLVGNDHEGLMPLFGDDNGFSFAGARAQMPEPDFIDRIPPILPGEAVIVVESFALWSPFMEFGLAQRRLTHTVATRPRFTQFIRLEGVDPIIPEDYYELAAYADENSDDDDDDASAEPVCNAPGDPGCPVGNETVVDMDFTGGGIGGWSHGAINSGGAGVGQFLGPFGGDTFDNPVTFNVSLGGPAVSTTIDFDLFIIDSWDGYSRQWADMRGDNMTLVIDGTPISMDVFDWQSGRLFHNDRFTEGVLDGTRYTVEMELISDGSNLYGSHFPDQLWRVTVTLEAPPQQFDFGLSANLDQGIHDESFGISRFRVQADYGTPLPAAFTPDPATLQGTDHHTRFPIYGGCPDTRLSAPWLTINNTDLTSPLIIQRRAGGDTRLQDCPDLPGWGWVHGSPHLVLRYDDERQRGNGRRLRLVSHDGNQGRTCDSTLLVRDPSGQWWYNDAISNWDWNAWLNMGHAGAGDYHIWIGTWAGNSCDADLIIERY